MLATTAQGHQRHFATVASESGCPPTPDQLDIGLLGWAGRIADACAAISARQADQAEEAANVGSVRLRAFPNRLQSHAGGRSGIRKLQLAGGERGDETLLGGGA
jgi:hypothetical protein